MTPEGLDPLSGGMDGSGSGKPLTGSEASPKFAWRTSKYGDEVERFELVRENDAFVIVRKPWGRPGQTVEQREAKETVYHRFHASELDAIQFLTFRASVMVKSLKRETNDANSRLHQLQKRLRILQAEGPAERSEAGTNPPVNPPVPPAPKGAA